MRHAAANAATDSALILGCVRLKSSRLERVSSRDVVPAAVTQAYAPKLKPRLAHSASHLCRPHSSQSRARPERTRLKRTEFRPDAVQTEVRHVLELRPRLAFRAGLQRPSMLACTVAGQHMSTHRKDDINKRRHIMHSGKPLIERFVEL